MGVRAWSAGIVLLAALSLSGCGSDDQGAAATCGPPAEQPMRSAAGGRYAPTLGAFPQSPTAAAALATTMEGLDPGRFTSIRVGRPPLTSPGNPVLWLRARPAASRVPHDLTAEWEAWLAAGAVGDRCAGTHQRMAEVMGGVSVAGSGGMGAVHTGQIFAAQEYHESDQLIVSQVDGVLRSFGLTPQKVRVVHPLGPAVWISATLDDRDVLADRLYALDLALDGPVHHERYEGVYLQIDQSNGTPLLRSFLARRVGGGGVWFAPGIDELWGINHG